MVFRLLINKSQKFRKPKIEIVVRPLNPDFFGFAVITENKLTKSVSPM